MAPRHAPTPLPPAPPPPVHAPQHPVSDADLPILSFWGPDPVPLPQRFARIKRQLVQDHDPAVLQASWARLIRALRADVDHIEGLGAHLIPSVEYADAAANDPAQTARFGRDLKRYGVGVMRGVLPRREADAAVRETVAYLESTNDFQASPLPQDTTCFDYFWTPAQVRARAHPHVLRAQSFIMGLWDTEDQNAAQNAAQAQAQACAASDGDRRVATRFPVTYADRLRIHGTVIPPSAHGTLGAKKLDIRTDGPSSRHPEPADDWFSAIQSSCVIAQVDNGSLERWEPDGYQRNGTYSRVFEGAWDAWDPWECATRVNASADLYNGYGACSAFRMFQGVLALSTIEPGIIRLLPSPKLATAYFLLRPFFRPKTPAPQIRDGPAWDAFLDPSNWELCPEQDSIIHGAVPGHSQRVTELWHPHLELRRSMITLPTLQPGDYIFWHPDLAYHITAHSSGNSSRPDDLSMIIYLPAAPLTQSNALYLARQRKAFQRGHPGPDFDCGGTRLGSETPQCGRMGEKEIEELGGVEALRAMGLAPWDEASALGQGEEDVVMRDGGGGGGSDWGPADAETELVKLANVILFPDQFSMGCG